MKSPLPVTGLLVVCAIAGPAQADIPTADASQLTERSQTSSTTLKLVPITINRQSANQGVNCAVTTGKQAGVTDPTVQPQAGTGTRAVQAYGPDLPTTPDPGARGAALSTQTLAGSTGDVVAGLDASRSTLGATSSAFRTAGQQAGTATTVMGALDMNSGVRVQNNLAWSATIGSANLWVTALNALNLARSSDASRVATGMASGTLSTAVAPSGPACPVGTIGSGTSADPCRPTTGACSVAALSACATIPFVDGNGGVSMVLLPVGMPSSSGPLSLTDVVSALATAATSQP